MIQYKRINLKLSNLQLKKLKSSTNNAKDVPLSLSFNMIGTNKTNFQHRLLSTNRHISRFCQAFLGPFFFFFFFFFVLISNCQKLNTLK